MKVVRSYNSSNTVFLQNLVLGLEYPRTRKWPMIDSPVPTLIIIIFYFTAIYQILPKFMKHRQAYCLKNIILFYNIFQIAACTFLVAKSIPLFSWTCENIDFSETNARSVKMLKICHYTYFLKTSELLETMFFVLRKKERQVSELHVYHHVSTLLTSWFFAKYFGGGMSLFVLVLNSTIHIIMYTYYLLSSLDLKWQNKVTQWKSTITTLQMVQFCIFIAYALQVFGPSCTVSPVIALVFIPNVLVNFRMFWNFYKRSYLKSTKKTS